MHARLRYLMLAAVARQKLLRERASVLHYTYIACLVSVCVIQI